MKFIINYSIEIKIEREFEADDAQTAAKRTEARAKELIDDIQKIIGDGSIHVTVVGGVPLEDEID